MTAATTTAGTLDRAIDDYLTYLRVERGVADATIRAYRGDLSDFAISRGAAARGRQARRSPSAISRRVPGEAARTNPGSPRRACGGAPRRSVASTASPTGTG